MHFVVFNASFRKKGNSEILSRLVLREALKQGADTGEIINLRDFHLDQCNGCMRCVFKNERCPLPDDFYPLMDNILKADAFLLIAPTYVTTIPGSLKLLIDRYLLMPPYFGQLYLRPAASIGIASPIDWFSSQLPFMNIFLLGLGFKIEESFIVYGAGPGEVLLENDVLSRLKSTVKRLCSSALNPAPVSFPDQLSEHCPVCFTTLFERIDEKRIRCPICHSQAEWKETGFFFREESMKNHRWTKSNIEDHFKNWILRTKDIFRQNLPQIIQRKRTLGL
ncbi:MAG: NAD(P)H-dependent oxidoreductase [Candidatus Aminicenantia bacterium]